MKINQFFLQSKVWIMLTLAMLIITQSSSIRAVSPLLETNMDNTTTRDLISTTSSITNKGDSSLSNEDEEKVQLSKNGSVASAIKSKEEIPGLYLMPFANIALSDVTDISFSQANYSFLYNMEHLQTEIIQFETKVKTKFNTESDSGTFPAGSTLELTSSSPITEVVFSEFDTMKSEVGSFLEVYVDGSSAPFYSQPISGDEVTVKLPEGKTTCKALFTKNVVPKDLYKELKIVTYAKVDSDLLMVGNSTLKLTATIPKIDSNMSKISTNEFVDIGKPLTYEMFQGYFVPEPSNIVSPEELKKNSNVNYKLRYYLNYRDTDNKSPQFLRLNGTTFKSHTDKDMILKELIILKGFSGLRVEGVDAKETFDLFINDKIFSSDLSVLEDHKFVFPNDEHREFKIVLHNGVVQHVGSDREFAKDISAIYKCKGDGTKGAYPIYIEGETKTKENTISNLSPNPSGIGTKGIDTYFLQTPFLKNESTKKVHSVGENIVFNLTDLYASKYVGDYSRNHITFETSTDLKEYYYLKQVDLVPIVRPLNLELPNNINLQLYNGATQESADGGKISDRLYTFTNNDATISASQLAGLSFKPQSQGIDTNVLEKSEYDIFAAIGGLDLSDFKVTLTYAPRADKKITEDMVFTNNVLISMRPTSNVSDPLSKKALISGTTEIKIATDSEKPDSGNPDSGNPDSEKPDSGNPDLDSQEPPSVNPPGRDPHDPTYPPVFGDTDDNVISNDDGTYTMIGDDNVHKGVWKWDKKSGIWIYEKYILGIVPTTGDKVNFSLWFGILLISGLGGTVLLQCKNKRSVKYGEND